MVAFERGLYNVEELKKVEMEETVKSLDIEEQSAYIAR